MGNIDCMDTAPIHPGCGQCWRQVDERSGYLFCSSRRVHDVKGGGVVRGGGPHDLEDGHFNIGEFGYPCFCAKTKSRSRVQIREYT